MGTGDAPGTQTGTGQAAPTGRGERPTGVSILAILAFLQGLLLLAGGAALMVLGPGMFPLPGTSALPAVFLAAIGGFLALIGLLYFLVGWGFWNGAEWAWLLGIVLAVIGLLGFPIGTLISIVILYYLTRPRVKRFFGRGEPQGQARAT